MFNKAIGTLTLYTFLDSRRRWATLAVILGMLFLVRLGIWQLDRLEWRRGLNAATLAELNAAPISLNDDLSGTDLTELINRQVTVSGSYDVSEQFIIESQSFEGVEPGRYLVTPFVLENDPTQAVLVNRGFLPVGVDTFDQYDPPSELLEIEARIQKSQILSGDRETEVSPDRRIFRIDVAAADGSTSYDLLPVYLLPTVDETALVSQTLPRPVAPDLVLDEGNHLSYAYQWFSFAILLLVMYVIVVYRQEALRPQS